jgi:hypothetical protein
VTSGRGVELTVNWRSVEAQIWVDTPSGRGRWQNQPAFGFAPSKVASYGLHELFAEHFEMSAREALPHGAKAVRTKSSPGRKLSIASERLVPIEVVGESSGGERAGVVYLLKSAYGYKVGRSRNPPARMRTFGVQLPFIYTIPLVAWFDDCVDAERRYHDMFRTKHINGEWFDLTEEDINSVRSRIVALGVQDSSS